MWACQRHNYRSPGGTNLVVENNVEKRTVDLQPAPVIVNEAQFPEIVHEMANPRAGCAHHLGEGLLTDRGDYSLGHAFLAKMGKQSAVDQRPNQSTAMVHLHNAVHMNLP